MTTKSEKQLCEGSGRWIELSEARELAPGTGLAAQCPKCTRILKPAIHEGKTAARMRQHSVRGRTTASLDRTRDILWAYAQQNGAS